VGVVDAHDVLFDDRPLVEHLGDVVGGGADQLDTAFAGALVGCRAGKGGKERVMDVDERAADRVEE
jgi:hypothetical protein